MLIGQKCKYLYCLLYYLQLWGCWEGREGFKETLCPMRYYQRRQDPLQIPFLRHSELPGHKANPEGEILGFPGGSDSWERMCLQCGRPGFHPWVGKMPWRRERLPTLVFCLENPMDRGAWQATVHGSQRRWNLPLCHTSLSAAQVSYPIRWRGKISFLHWLLLAILL